MGTRPHRPIVCLESENGRECPQNASNLPKRRDTRTSVDKCRKNGHSVPKQAHLRTKSVQQFLSKSVQIGPDRDGRET
jgi:hypothetical protein